VHITDWRNSPISRIFYCYEEGDEYEERLRRRASAPGWSRRAARSPCTAAGSCASASGERSGCACEDDGWGRLTIDVGRLAGGAGTAMRAPELRRARLRGPDQRLPEITALIDREQFAAITTERSGVVIIRGGAGTGKTTIGAAPRGLAALSGPEAVRHQTHVHRDAGLGLARYIAQVLPSLEVPGVPIVDFPKFALESMRRVLPRMAKRKTTDDTPSEARA
jgi:DNA helicase-2/ATP-dependent DNA helicase PcrA